jgi:hypothetical protein
MHPTDASACDNSRDSSQASECSRAGVINFRPRRFESWAYEIRNVFDHPNSWPARRFGMPGGFPRPRLAWTSTNAFIFPARRNANAADNMRSS